MSSSIKTIGQIKTEVLSYANDGSTSDLANQLYPWIIDIHREVESAHDFSWLIRYANITLKEGKSLYSLPSDYRKMTDPDCVRIGGNQYQVTYIDEYKFEENYGTSRFETGATIQFYRLGGSPVFVENQPTIPDRLTVVSDNTADTSQTIYFEGTVNGIEGVTDSVTLDGTVIVRSNKTFSSVKRVSKSATTSGIVTVTSNGSENIVKLPYRTCALQFRPITFHPIPNSELTDTTATVKYYASIPDPLDDGDISSIPDPMVLVHGLLYRAYKKKNDPRESQEFQLYQEYIARLIEDDNRIHSKHADYRPLFRHARNLSV